MDENEQKFCFNFIQGLNYVEFYLLAHKNIWKNDILKYQFEKLNCSLCLSVNGFDTRVKLISLSL